MIMFERVDIQWKWFSISENKPISNGKLVKSIQSSSDPKTPAAYQEFVQKQKQDNDFSLKRFFEKVRMKYTDPLTANTLN